MIDVLTPNRISPYCPLKNNQRQVKISILTLLYSVWLWGVMHTEEIDSAVRCTPQRLTLRSDAYRGVFWYIVCSWLLRNFEQLIWCTRRSFLATLACLTAAPMSWNLEKNRGQNLVRFSLYVADIEIRLQLLVAPEHWQ